MSGASLAEIAAILRLATANPRLNARDLGRGLLRLRRAVRRVPAPRGPHASRGRRAADEGPADQGDAAEPAGPGRQPEGDSRVSVGSTPGPFAAPMPWPEETIRTRLADPGRPGLAQADDASLKAQLVNWVANYSEYRADESLRDLFVRTVADVRAAGVEVVPFVPPLSRCELTVIDSTGSWGAFQTWKRRLLDAGPYWDFSGFGKLDTHGLPVPRRRSLLARRGPCHASPVPRARLWAVRHGGRHGARRRRVGGRGVHRRAPRSAGHRAAAARSSSHRCARVVEEMLRERESAARTRGALNPEPIRP